jgi:hypothetical protein
MASGADALVRAGPPGPALSAHSKHGLTRASAAVQVDRPPLAFVKNFGNSTLVSCRRQIVSMSRFSYDRARDLNRAHHWHRTLTIPTRARSARPPGVPRRHSCRPVRIAPDRAVTAGSGTQTIDVSRVSAPQTDSPITNDFPATAHWPGRGVNRPAACDSRRTQEAGILR